MLTFSKLNMKLSYLWLVAPASSTQRLAGWLVGGLEMHGTI